MRAALAAANAAVLQAPPGAGKTTRVPLALMEQPWLGAGRIVMLEPRRLAARAAAQWMARTLGEPVGQRVGYRVRHDTRVGPLTRLEVVTEGVLTRLLQSDPTLEDVGLLIFDEFHERSLHADLGLALALHAQRLVRPDLRILIMSATIDVAPIAQLLGGAALIVAEGREFPVETRYLAQSSATSRDRGEIERRVVITIRQALPGTSGDMLVFLPGIAEIRRVARQLDERALGSGIEIVTLHGALTQDEQNRAILPSARGIRKIVLATSIAETSLTIEGIRTVIDSGLARVPRFSPRTGMTRLETVRVSRASADQRRGRAGRVAPGICFRLWSEVEQQQLVPHATPEILEADLAPLALELAVAGVFDPLDLSWLDPPPAAALAQAHEILRELEAIDADGRPTSHGRAMAPLGVHPRLAHMLIRAESLGAARTACAIAALIGDRDLFRSESLIDADVRTRLEVIENPVAREAVDRSTLHRVQAEADRLSQLVNWSRRRERVEPQTAGVLVALAYPDRIARRRGARGRFVLRNGRGAILEPSDPLAGAEFLAVAAIDDRQPEGRIFLAAPLQRNDLEEHFGQQIVIEREIVWDDASNAVAATHRERLGAIVLTERAASDADPLEVAAALVRALTASGVDSLPWSDAARRLRQRLAFLHHVDPSFPDVGDAALASSMPQWLAPRVLGMRRRQDVTRLDLGAALTELLDRRQRAALDQLAPTHLVVPSGSRIPIDYSEAATPVLAVRLQEMFGLADTPRIFAGRVPLTLHLLSPANRPLQVTRDLAGFWRTSYYDVQREMRGRYPKHDWPDDPLAAVPTARARRRPG